MVRTVTFVAVTPGIGSSSLVANLAVALARRGLHVAALDGDAADHGVASQLGVTLTDDLAAVIRRERSIDEVVRFGPQGVRLAAAGIGARMLGALPVAGEQRLVDAFGGLDPAPDMLLVDAPPAQGDAATPWTLAASEVVIVVSPGADAITQAYGLMKRLSRDAARRRFHVIVNRARQADQASAVFHNLETTARQYLRASVEWLGSVPEDPDMGRAARLRQAVVGAFPQSAAAAALRAIADTVMHWPYAGEDCLDGFVHRLAQAHRSPLSANA